MTLTWLLGAAGLVAIEGSYVPQIVRLFRLRKADEISYLFPGLNLAGRVMALAYSVAVGNSVFTVGFFVGAALRLVLLLQVAWYRHQPSRPDLSRALPSLVRDGAQ
jgi:lipid-A-disaccharide synthase-like uncharacterized protein